MMDVNPVSLSGTVSCSETMVYVNILTDERVHKRPQGPQVTVIINNASKREHDYEFESALFEEESMDSGTEEEKAVEEEPQAHCDYCHLQLIQPGCLSQCRSVLCGLCSLLTVQYTHQCPVCNDNVVLNKRKDPIIYDNSGDTLVEESPYPASNMNDFSLRNTTIIISKAFSTVL
jgi:hypothetical protein